MNKLKEIHKNRKYDIQKAINERSYVSENEEINIQNPIEQTQNDKIASNKNVTNIPPLPKQKVFNAFAQEESYKNKVFTKKDNSIFIYLILVVLTLIHSYIFYTFDNKFIFLSSVLIDFDSELMNSDFLTYLLKLLSNFTLSILWLLSALTFKRSKNAFLVFINISVFVCLIWIASNYELFYYTVAFFEEFSFTLQRLYDSRDFELISVFITYLTTCLYLIFLPILFILYDKRYFNEK
ncbi:MAG: hypothetical protein GY760_06610 [Deltaproteobacteria bacterium]|nr:hypothetical protein [Deltaproteobacteria bacterium]